MERDTGSSSHNIIALNGEGPLKDLMTDDSKLTFDDLKFGTGCEPDLMTHMERQSSDQPEQKVQK